MKVFERINSLVRGDLQSLCEGRLRDLWKAGHQLTSIQSQQHFYDRIKSRVRHLKFVKFPLVHQKMHSRRAVKAFIELDKTFLLQLFQRNIDFMGMQVKTFSEFTQIKIITFTSATSQSQLVIVAQRLVYCFQELRCWL